MDFGSWAILLCSAALLVLAVHLISKVRARHRRRAQEMMPLPVFFRLQPQEERAHAGNGNGGRDALRRIPGEHVDGSRRPAPTMAPLAVASPARGGEQPVRRAEPTTDEKTVVFQRFSDGPLQLLPGRLEIVEGDGEGRDIRFMRAWGEPPEVTFGRSRGPAHRHVQLAAPTVSRNHARMELEGERWKIINLSATNPVVINGLELQPHTDRYLEEGDKIEMGEVIFRFRER